MKPIDQLKERSENACELCKSTENLQLFYVPFSTGKFAEEAIYACENCIAQIEKKAELDPKHWQCLSESMWSEFPAVQVVAWRLLNRLKQESWAVDNLDMLYLEAEVLAWAEASGDQHSDGNEEFHRDCNGVILQQGDTVTLIKDLDVKGSSLNAKIGTAVRMIRLVHDNTEQIEGKVEGQTIVILTKYVKKQG